MTTINNDNIDATQCWSVMITSMLHMMISNDNVDITYIMNNYNVDVTNDDQ